MCEKHVFSTPDIFKLVRSLRERRLLFSSLSVSPFSSSSIPQISYALFILYAFSPKNPPRLSLSPTHSQTISQPKMAATRSSLDHALRNSVFPVVIRAISQKKRTKNHLKGNERHSYGILQQPISCSSLPGNRKHAIRALQRVVEENYWSSYVETIKAFSHSDSLLAISWRPQE